MTIRAITINAVNTASFGINPDELFDLLANIKFTKGRNADMIDALRQTKHMNKIIAKLMTVLRDDEVLLMIKYPVDLKHNPNRIILKNTKVALCTLRKGDVMESGSSFWKWNGKELTRTNEKSETKFSTDRANRPFQLRFPRNGASVVFATSTNSQLNARI